MLKIVTVPNQILTAPAEEVKVIDNKIKNIVKEMIETLEAQDDPPGVGLAANQVGLDLSLFIIKPTLKAKVKVFINPKIIESKTLNDKPRSVPLSGTSQDKENQLEGCLSIPKIWSPVKRPQEILLEYKNLEGEKKTEWFSGFEAVIIQHEIDHLNGFVFTQRALEQDVPLYEEKDKKLEKLDF